MLEIRCASKEQQPCHSTVRSPASDPVSRVCILAPARGYMSMDHGVLAEVTNPNNLNDGPCNALLIHDGRLGLNRPLRVVL